MSKGRTPKACKGPKPVVSVRERLPKSGNVDVAFDRSRCWDFNLVSVLTAVLGINEGDLVFGVVQHGRIAVNSLMGLIGHAPDDVSQEIILFMQQSGLDNLQGVVTAKEGEAEVSIKLCLY